MNNCVCAKTIYNHIGKGEIPGAIKNHIAHARCV